MTTIPNLPSVGTLSGAAAVPVSQGGTTYQATAASIAALVNVGVGSFNSRTGAVTLTSADVISALGFVPSSGGGGSSGVSTFNTRTGAVTLTSGDVTTALGFTPLQTAPVGSVFGRTGSVVLQSADVTGALGYTPIQTAPVASVATRTGAITLTHNDIADWTSATAGFGAGTTGVSSWGGRTGVVTMTLSDITGTLGYTPENQGNKNIASGYAGLNTSAKLPMTLIDATGATSGQVLSFNGTAWAPATPASGGGTITSSAITTALGYVPENPSNKNIASGYYGLNSNGRASLITLDATGATTGQVMSYNGAAWAPANMNSGVTSVTLAMEPTVFSITTPTITTSGTISVAFVAQAADTLFSGPATGTVAPSFKDVTTVLTGKYGNGTANQVLVADGAGGISWGAVSAATTGALIAANNLSDLTNAATARANLGFTGSGTLQASKVLGTNAAGTAITAVTLSGLTYDGTTLAATTGGGGTVTSVSGGTTGLTFTNGTTTPTLGGFLLPANIAASGATTGQVLTYNGSTWAAATPASGGGTGTVTSVAMTAPSNVFTVTGSPLTTSGTLALGFAVQANDTVLAGPNTGSAIPAFTDFATVITNKFGTGLAGQALVSNGTASGVAWGTVSTASTSHTQRITTGTTAVMDAGSGTFHRINVATMALTTPATNLLIDSEKHYIAAGVNSASITIVPASGQTVEGVTTNYVVSGGRPAFIMIWDGVGLDWSIF